MYRPKYIISAFLLTFFLLDVLLVNKTLADKYDCEVKDVSDYQWGVRSPADLPALLEITPGSIVEECFIMIGVGEHPLSLTARGISISVNGAPATKDKPVEVKDGDTLRIWLQVPNRYNVMWTNRLEFRESDSERRRKIYRIVWNTQTLNTPREPKIWHIGPSRKHRQLKEILQYLAAGDTIYLDPNAVYEPVEIKNISGTEALPIRLIGNTKDASSRPVFAGGGERFNWTLAVRYSHNWSIENVILQDGGLCFRNEATNTVLKNVLIQRCSTGVLSTDLNSGNFSMFNVEVTESGGKKNGRPWGHAIYVASDQHSFPGSKFVLKHSYLHDNRGNSIKSRYENTLIRDNWIESGSDRQAKYLLELIGYDQKYDFSGQQFKIKNNTILMRPPGLGSRIGGDGNSGTRGDVLFENNLFLIDDGFRRTIIRTFQGLNSVTLRDNTIAFIESDHKTILLTDEVPDNKWVDGRPVIRIENNVVTESTFLLKRDEISDTNDTSKISISDNLTLPSIITSNKKVDQLRPQKGDYILIKSF